MNVLQEVKPNMLERLENYELPIEKMLDELMDGDILVFQRDETELSQYELPTAKDYYKYVQLSLFLSLSIL